MGHDPRKRDSPAESGTVGRYALLDVRVFNPYAPSNRQPLIAIKGSPHNACISTSNYY